MKTCEIKIKNQDKNKISICLALLVLSFFDNLKSDKNIILNAHKRKLLISFISDLLQIALNSFSRKTVIEAFIRNGMLDQQDRLWPDFHQITKTVGYKLKDGEKHLILDNFDLLYKTVRDFGHISEEIFNKLGFPMTIHHQEKLYIVIMRSAWSGANVQNFYQVFFSVCFGRIAFQLCKIKRKRGKNQHLIAVLRRLKWQKLLSNKSLMNITLNRDWFIKINLYQLILMLHSPNILMLPMLLIVVLNHLVSPRLPIWKNSSTFMNLTPFVFQETQIGSSLSSWRFPMQWMVNAVSFFLHISCALNLSLLYFNHEYGNSIYIYTTQ